MTVPHLHAQLSAFDPHWFEPVDLTSQVKRWPGTADAACLCGRSACGWPFCLPDKRKDEP